MLFCYVFSHNLLFLNVSFQLLDMLKFYTGFEINDQTGNALTENEMTTIHYDRITSLQVIEILRSPYSGSIRFGHAIN